MGSNINVFDVFEQAAFTDLVRRALLTAWETVPAMGDQISPLVPCYDMKIEREIAEVAAIGMAQFRSPDASPRIHKPKIQYTQEATSLAIIDEMDPIDEDKWQRLNSPTPNIKARAGVDLITRGKILALRAETRTEWWRWQVFRGQSVVLPVSGNQQITVTYNYLNSNIVSSGVPWTDQVSSTPIDDLKSWQTVVSNSAGVYASQIHMNTNTWRTLQLSNQARGYLTPTDRNISIPTTTDVQQMLLGAPSANPGGGKVAAPPQIILTDAGFRDEDVGFARGQNAMTKFLPDGEVLLTTPYVFEGEPISDTPDGIVTLSAAFNELVTRQGPQAEIIVDHFSKTHFLRQAAARFVRLRRPEAFCIATAFE